jgi:hypothetical protein
MLVAVVDEDRSCSVTAAVGSPMYISNIPKSQGSDHSLRCGTRTNPWIIEAQTGQRISISLLDFGRQQRRPDHDVTNQTAAANGFQQGIDSCMTHYGYIVDKTASNSRNITICATGIGFQRDRFVYQSTGSAIEIVLSSPHAGSENNQNKFLVGFKGQKAVITVFAPV